MGARNFRLMPPGAGIYWEGLAPNLRGAILVLVSGLMFSLMAMLIKMLGNRLDSFQMVFFRALFGFLTILPFALNGGLRNLHTRHPFKHLFRGTLGVSAMFCMFYAITQLPLADAVALTFTKPLFLIVLAVIFLGEAVHWRRWTATAVGFAGVLVMLRPGAGIETAALFALLGSFLMATVSVLIKQLSGTEKTVTILFYFGLFSTLGALVPALFVWIRPTALELVMLMGAGLLGTLAQNFMIRGLAVGEATAVSPFDYARLIYSGILGFIVFSELPDGWSLLGAGIIVGSTLYIARREAIRARQKGREAIRARQKGREAIRAREEGREAIHGQGKRQEGEGMAALRAGTE